MSTTVRPGNRSRTAAAAGDTSVSTTTSRSL